ncbi:hypothetical protein BBP40_009994 [Aspergillus hancockii]|nr:hypothetical protein BBP40_009994 [Aspergillus hancockii]
MSEEQDLADGHQLQHSHLDGSNETTDEQHGPSSAQKHSGKENTRPPPHTRYTQRSRMSQLSRRKTNQTTHSLAGPRVEDPRSVYVHPEYRDMNPKYGQTDGGPLWGLAKPLPRVVRPGMRHNDDGAVTSAYPAPQKGESEPVPELDATPNREDDQREEKAHHGVYSPQASGTDDPMVHREMGMDSPDRVSRPVEDEVTEDEGKPGGAPEHTNKWSMIRHKFREPFAEWLGTTIAMLIGLCGTLAISTGGNNAGGKIALYWGWALAIMAGIYVAGGISGGHLNPAISIALWLYRGFPGRRCVQYVVAQILGALTAAGLAYCMYRDSILNNSPGVSMGAAGLGFYTEPLETVRNVTAFFNEFLAAAILICTIFAMGDDSNAPPGAGMHSLIIGLLIFALEIGFGLNTGGCFNPARDLGPRLVALMTGHGGITFTERRGWWFWGAWLATLSGALAGGAMYDIFIFIGGESPINYPRTRIHRVKLKREAKWRKKLKLGTQRLPSIEEGLKELDQ